MTRNDGSDAGDLKESVTQKRRAARRRGPHDTLPAPQAVLDPVLDVRREEVDLAGDLPGVQLEDPDVRALRKPRRFRPQHRG